MAVATNRRRLDTSADPRLCIPCEASDVWLDASILVRSGRADLRPVAALPALDFVFLHQKGLETVVGGLEVLLGPDVAPLGSSGLLANRSGRRKAVQHLDSAGGQRGRNTAEECNALALGRMDPRCRDEATAPTGEVARFRNVLPAWVGGALGDKRHWVGGRPAPLWQPQSLPAIGGDFGVSRSNAVTNKGPEGPLLIRRCAATPARSILGPSGRIDAASTLSQSS